MKCWQSSLPTFAIDFISNIPGLPTSCHKIIMQQLEGQNGKETLINNSDHILSYSIMCTPSLIKRGEIKICYEYSFAYVLNEVKLDFLHGFLVHFHFFHEKSWPLFEIIFDGFWQLFRSFRILNAVFTCRQATYKIFPINYINYISVFVNLSV